jgi:hypothetical protein
MTSIGPNHLQAARGDFPLMPPKDRAMDPAQRRAMASASRAHTRFGDLAALQRTVGNQAVCALVSEPKTPALEANPGLHAGVARRARPAEPSSGVAAGGRHVQRALTIDLFVPSAKNRYRWTIKGRPAFSKATTSGLPVESGYHRAHTTSWEDIRSTTQQALNEEVDWWVFDAFIRGIFEYGVGRWPFVEECLEESLQDLVLPSQRPPQAAIDLVKKFLTVVNECQDNLTPGIGSVNSKLQGHFDPKVRLQGGLIDLTEQAHEAIVYAPQHVQPLLLDRTQKYIFASTYSGGRIPVKQATGTLREMIRRRHFKVAK